MKHSVIEQQQAALVEIKLSQAVTAALIAAFEASAPRELAIPEVAILLGKGERYAGLQLDAEGAASHHLVLLEESFSGTWDQAVVYAKSIGAELPTRCEQSLLFANLSNQFKKEWHWSSEQHAGNSVYAWLQGFGFGYQFLDFKSGSRLARFVRRLAIQ